MEKVIIEKVWSRQPCNNNEDEKDKNLSMRICRHCLFLFIYLIVFRGGTFMYIIHVTFHNHFNYIIPIRKSTGIITIKEFSLKTIFPTRKIILFHILIIHVDCNYFNLGKKVSIKNSFILRIIKFLIN